MRNKPSRKPNFSTYYQELVWKLKSLPFVTIFALILSAVSYADITQTGPNNFEAGINSNEFEYFTSAPSAGIQRQDMWCWAASVQMVLNYHGLYVAQEGIVQRIKGRLVNEGGTDEEVMMALNGWGPDNRGRFSGVQALSGDALNSLGLINSLAYKYPLIAELNNPDGGGHAVVLTAVGFHNVATWNGYGYVSVPVLDYAIYRDPWGRGTASKQVEYWSSFQARLRHLNQVFVTRY